MDPGLLETTKLIEIVNCKYSRHEVRLDMTCKADVIQSCIVDTN